MTKSLKVKILAVLLTVLLAMGGLFLANTTKVNASVSIATDGSNTLVVDSFVIREGASIRLGVDNADLNDDELKKQMGIKFVAQLSTSDYQALRGFENVQYGVFIMPKAYATATELGPINYDNCFGENKIYYGPEEFEKLEDTTGKYKIHNIETLPKYVEEKDYKGYIVQGSIVNMLDQNLNLELIGVPYIIAEKDGNPYYAFAQNAHDNVRTVVEVAQNLLDKNGYNANDPVDRVKQGYVTRFLKYYEDNNNNEKFKTSYNAEFYLRNSKGEYVLDASKTRKVDVEMSSDIIAETVAAKDAPEHDGYVALTGLNGAFNAENEFVYDSKLLKVDGSTTLKFIYQEDKENIFFNTSMMNGSLGWSSTLDLDSNAWSMSGNSSLFFASAGTTELHYGTGLSSTVSKDAEGNHIYGQQTTKRGGWKLSNIYFPTTTSKFSFWYVNLGTENATIRITFNATAGDYGPNRTGDFFRALGPTKTPRKIEFQVTKTVNEESVITEIGAIHHINIYCTSNVYVDNFAWEKDLYVEQTLVTADADKTANLGNLKQNVKSTKYSKSELESVEVSNVSAQAISSGTDLEKKVAVVNNDGTYTLNGLEPKGYYDYTFNVAYDGKTADGKGFVKANSGLSQIISFDKYSNNGTWYDGVNRTKYITDEEYAKNGLLQLDVEYRDANYGVIRGSVVNFGLINDYSLRVFPARTLSSGKDHVFWLNYYNRSSTGASSAGQFTFTQAKNMTTVCFFVYNASATIYNNEELLKHSYYATAVAEDGTTALTTASATSSFSLGELKPGWNYVEHNIVDAYKDQGAVKLTSLVTRINYHITAEYYATLLFDAYTVR